MSNHRFDRHVKRTVLNQPASFTGEAPVRSNWGGSGAEQAGLPAHVCRRDTVSTRIEYLWFVSLTELPVIGLRSAQPSTSGASFESLTIS